MCVCVKDREKRLKDLQNLQERERKEIIKEKESRAIPEARSVL